MIQFLVKPVKKAIALLICAIFLYCVDFAFAQDGKYDPGIKIDTPLQVKATAISVKMVLPTNKDISGVENDPTIGHNNEKGEWVAKDKYECAYNFLGLETYKNVLDIGLQKDINDIKNDEWTAFSNFVSYSDGKMDWRNFKDIKIKDGSTVTLNLEVNEKNWATLRIENWGVGGKNLKPQVFTIRHYVAGASPTPMQNQRQQMRCVTSLITDKPYGRSTNNIWQQARYRVEQQWLEYGWIITKGDSLARATAQNSAMVLISSLKDANKYHSLPNSIPEPIKIDISVNSNKDNMLAYKH